MHGIWRLALKDLRQLSRDKFSLFWLFVMPLIMALFIGSMFGGGPSSALRVAVVDDDRSPASEKFLKALSGSEAVRLLTARGGEEGDAPLTLNEARDLVRRGQAAAYLHIQKGFGDNPAGFVPEADKLELGVDPSRKAEAGLLQGVLMENLFSGMADLFTKPEAARAEMKKATANLDKAKALSREQKASIKTLLADLDRFLGDANLQGKNAKGSPFANLKLRVTEVAGGDKTGPRSAFEITFPQSITWGMLGCIAAFAMSTVQERRTGTYLRLRVSPLSRAQILAGKGLACFLACIAVMALVLGFARLFFGLRVDDPAKLALAIACSAVCFVGMMLTMSVLGRTERAVAGSVWALNMPLAMIGGGMIPLIAMPPWMQTLSNFSPVKWMIYSLEGAIWRGFTYAEMALPCAILVGVGVLFSCIGVAVLNRRDAL
jgi:ABC-2 type transport system permease protein